MEDDLIDFFYARYMEQSRGLEKEGEGGGKQSDV